MANRATYTTRFGDVVDAETHETLRWEPHLVRPGIYGDGTRAWIANGCAAGGLPVPNVDDEGNPLTGV